MKRFRFSKQNKRKIRRRIVSVLMAVVVFLTTYALVLPAITLDGETAAQEPGIEIAQPAPEAATPEPAPVQAEPAAAEPIAAVPAAAEPAQPDPAAAEAAAPVTDPAATEIADGPVPMAAPDAAAASGQDAAAGGSAAADPAAAAAGTSDASANPEAEGQNAEIGEKKDPEEETKDEENKEENTLAASPLVYDTAEYLVTVSFGAEAQLPEGTTLTWREFGSGSNEYNLYYPIVCQGMTENGAENPEEAISALRVFALGFTDQNGSEIRPAAPVDVLVSYKQPTNPIENEKLYGVTFRADDGQPTRASLLERNARDSSACVEAAGGVIQNLHIEDLAANDVHTNLVIAQLAWNPDSPNTEEELVVQDEEEVTVRNRRVPVAGAAYTLNLQYGSDAGIPEDAVFTAVPLAETHADYEEYKDRALSAVNTQAEGSPILLGLFDLTIYDAQGNVIEPLAPITVTASLGDAMAETEDVYAVHFLASSADPAPEQIASGEIAPAAEAPLEVIEAESSGTKATFEADSLSVIALVGTTIEKTVLASDGLNYKVTVTYGADAKLPDDADLSVTELNHGDVLYNHYLEESAAKLGKDAESISYARIFDISLVSRNDSNIHYQPDADVTVSIELADADENQLENLKVLHISDDQVDVLDSSTEGNLLNFQTGSFSIYPIVDEGENARIGYRFWYNDGTQNILLSTQYFRYKDVHPTSGNALELYQPSIPGMETATWNRIFNGWSKSAALTEPLYTLHDLNEELRERSNSAYNEEVIDLYANLTNVYYVTYVDVHPNNVLATEIVPKEDEGDTTFTIRTKAELLPTIDSDADLNGWYELDNMDTVYAPGQSDVVITGDMTLYPSVEGGHWLIFNDNDPVWDANKGQYVSGGASFTPPAFYLDETTVEPDAPTWTGYTFGGWYTTPNCNDGEEFVFGNKLTINTTVYAKWIPSASQYRVIIWKERTSDDVDLPNENKTYDYVTSYLINEDVSTGDVVNLANSYKNIYGSNGTSSDTDKVYFIYNNSKTDQSVTVKADGSSVLNVYYDRKPVTLDYYIWDYGYTATTSNNGTQYGLVDGQYVQLKKEGNIWTYGTGEYEYIYSVTSNNTGEQYGLVDGQYVQLDRHWGLFSGFYWTYGDEIPYTGTRYTRSQTEIRETYNGTRYTQNNSRSWRLYKSFTGLYGSTLEENGYTWPDEKFWYSNGGNNGTTSGTRTTFMSAFLPTDVDASGNAVTVNFYGSDPSGSRYIHFLIQKLDGTYIEKDTMTAGNGGFYISDKYIGYHAFQYRADNGNWYSAGNKGNNGYYNNGNTVSYSNNLYIRFNLNEHTLTFYTNNGSNQKIDYAVLYSESLSEHSGQTEGQKNGYYFLGWYADPSCTEPFDFTQTMPDNNVAVYGKWKIIRTRVVIEPGAENVYMGSQAKTFRLDYDERIDGGLMETATRAGYILDGWYTDPEFTNRFLFSNPVNSQTTGVDTTYGSANNWAAARAAYGDDTEDYENVRNILHLYAKWILDPDTSGYNIVYDAGDAALRDDLGNLLTTVPIDTRMYAFGEDVKPSTKEAPANYNELYSFAYWEATKEDGTTIPLYPSDPIPLSELQASETVTDEITGEIFRKTITLRAVYTTEAGDRLTHITYDGDTFTQILYPNGTREVHGKTKDGTQRLTITLDKEVNQTITLPDTDDFYLDGYELVGWSFFEGTYDEQLTSENNYNIAHADNTVKHFELGEQVAADNLEKNAVNNEENILYAMWKPKTYTVTVKQVIESGVPDSTFTYVYKRGAENDLESDQQQALTGNTSFELDTFTYYDISGHVIHITTPAPRNDSYDVRVNAIVTRDDGTTEILNPTALGNYPILGDVVITYTYSLKAEVKLQKRDAAAHGTSLTGATFVMTPVEYNTSTSRWENAGDGKNITISSETETIYLQEGTYKITETIPPTGYAAISSELYLTVTKEGEFSLFDSAGNAVDAQIAELTSNSKRVLTMYDNPIRTVTLSKTVDAANTEGSFSFKVTVFNSDGTSRLANTVIATQNETDISTNSIGEAAITLSHNQSVELKIPNGCKLMVEESANLKYIASYVWNSQESVDGNIFGSTPVEITTNGTLAYTNRLAPVQVVLKKVGVNNTDSTATETDLPGATFTIYTAETGGSIAKDANGDELRGKSSDSAGIFFSGELLPGKYYLEETTVPAGYNAPLGRFELEVISTDSAPVIKTSWITGDPSQSAGTVSSSTDAETGKTTYVVTVRNITGVVLPSTGGSGTLPYTIGGIALVGAAALLYGFRMKRRNKRSC